MQIVWGELEVWIGAPVVPFPVVDEDTVWSSCHAAHSFSIFGGVSEKGFLGRIHRRRPVRAQSVEAVGQ